MSHWLLFSYNLISQWGWKDTPFNLKPRLKSPSSSRLSRYLEVGLKIKKWFKKFWKFKFDNYRVHIMKKKVHPRSWPNLGFSREGDWKKISKTLTTFVLVDQIKIWALLNHYKDPIFTKFSAPPPLLNPLSYRPRWFFVKLWDFNCCQFGQLRN